MGLRIGRLALIFPSFVRFFLSFKAKFVSQFSPELCKLESLNMIYICRMSYCIVEMRLRVVALIFQYFHPFFFLSLYCILKFVLDFSQEF